jgi:hypothetical protein
MLYTIRQGGADEVEYRIRDTESGEDLPDRLPNALYSGVEFDEDGTGFFYTYRSRTTGPRIRHHTLGDDSAHDIEIWGEGIGPTAFINMTSLRTGGTASSRRNMDGPVTTFTCRILVGGVEWRGRARFGP